MFEWLPVAAGERILFLEIPGRDALESVAARIEHGVVVCLADRDAVGEARRGAVDLENVMFSVGSADEIPWQDGFFSHVLMAGEGLLTERLVCAEVARVMAGGGRLWVRAADAEGLIAAGLNEAEPAGGFRCFVKQEEPPRGRANGLRVIL